MRFFCRRHLDIESLTYYLSLCTLRSKKKKSLLIGLAPDKKYGVWGDSKNGYVVIGTGDNCWVYGEAPNGFLGVVGRSDLGIGVDGISNSTEAAGVVGYNYNSNGTGVYAGSNEIGGTGVFAFSFYGVYAVGGWMGVFAQNHLYGSRAYLGAPSVAGDFYDDIYVHGRIRTDGRGFQIDHPLDAFLLFSGEIFREFIFLQH